MMAGRVIHAPATHLPPAQAQQLGHVHRSRLELSQVGGFSPTFATRVTPE